MRRICLLVLSVILLTGAVRAADGDDKPKWYEKIDFTGDLRLRYEQFDWTDHYDGGERHRFRYRLRFGIDAHITENLDVGFQLRSGNPRNPISDNQTFDNGFDKTEISIAQAYADWQATGVLRVVAGKFRPKGLWSAIDIEYDDDLAVEGAMELLGWDFDGPLKQLDVNFWQLVLNESGSSNESHNFGGQVVPVFRLGEENSLAVGLTYETFTNPSQVADLYFNDRLVSDADYVTNLVDATTRETVSDFDLGNVFVKWSNESIKRWPIAVTGYYYKNFGSRDAMGVILPSAIPTGTTPTPLIAANSSDNDTAWLARIQIGDYKKPGQVFVRFTRYYSEPDAMLFAFSQSDSRRSTNVDGYRTDFRIGMPMKSWINVTWYRTDWTIGQDTTMDRWQFDYIFKF
jgi:hypothetical protein